MTLGGVREHRRTGDLKKHNRYMKGIRIESCDIYRPINLTSIMRNCLERTMTKRFRHFLETKHQFTQEKAGFRARRSTEDHFTTLLHTISERFHPKPVQRTPVTLIDFSHAFHTVCRNNLLMKMVDLKIPKHIVR